MNIINIKIF